MTDHVIQQKQIFNRGHHAAADWMERFEAELEVCRFLAERHPGKAKAWDALTARASGLVGKAAATGSAAQIEAAVGEAERLLEPIGRVAKGYTVYCAGHAHIDMNWMWSWPETVSITHDSFATVLKLMDEFPEFVFSQSQASCYAIIEEHNPAMFEAIVRRVKEGRWEVIASHWVENDKNMAGPESLCRHLLYTRAYVQARFGLSPEDVPIDWSPDTFGHAATIPSYLVRGGVRYLYLHRPGGEGPKRPAAFWWQAPDGARVLTRNDMVFAYNGVITPDNLLRTLRVTADETGLPITLYVYGVGDHGGGPTRRDLLRARDIMRWPIFPSVTLGTTRAFFEDLEKRGAGLPVLEGELNTEFTGCYTSQTLIKKANRFGETRLTDAEIAGSLAWAALGRTYPAARLEAGWRDVLFNHFHDILPGSGVHDTRTHAHGLFQKTMALTAMEETQSLRLLASHVDTSGFGGSAATEEVPASRLSTGFGAGVGYGTANGGVSAAEQSAGEGNRPLMIFNPSGWERDEVVEATLWDNAAPGQLEPFQKRAFSVRFADGRRIPAQTVKTGAYWGHDFVTVAFPVQVPALGYLACAVTDEAAGGAATTGLRHVGRTFHCGYSRYEREPEGLENDRIRLELDMRSGGIKSLVDKRSGAALIAADGWAPVLEYGEEMPHPMNAWVIGHNGPVEIPRVTGISRRGTGPWKAALDVMLTVRESAFTLTYELREGDPNLYLHLAGTWFERGTPQKGIPFLRFVFPFNLQGARGRYEIPFGALDREDNQGREVPMQQWAQVSGRCDGRPAGCLVLNDSKYGCSLDGAALRVTLIRSSYEPDPLPEIGQHEVHLALQPFGGELPVSEAMRAGRHLNHALRVVGTAVHAGKLPTCASLVSVTPASVVVNAVKKAEATDALVLTLSNPADKPVTARARCNATLLGKVHHAVEVDLLERPVAASTARKRGNTVSVDLPAHGIASVQVAFER